MSTAAESIKKFRSASGKEVRIALTTGHCFTIGKQWTEIPENLHAAAYRHGCISDDMDAFKEMKDNEVTFALANKKVAEKEELLTVIQGLIDTANPDDFLKSGKVDAGAMSREHGKTVSAQKRDEMWDKGNFTPVLFTEAPKED